MLPISGPRTVLAPVALLRNSFDDRPSMVTEITSLPRSNTRLSVRKSSWYHSELGGFFGAVYVCEREDIEMSDAFSSMVTSDSSCGDVELVWVRWRG